MVSLLDDFDRYDEIYPYVSVCRKEIYNLLSQDSRFLKYNDKEKLWEEVSLRNLVGRVCCLVRMIADKLR